MICAKSRTSYIQQNDFFIKRIDECSYMGVVNTFGNRHKTLISCLTIENLVNIEAGHTYFQSYSLHANMKALILITHQKQLAVLNIVI